MAQKYPPGYLEMRDKYRKKSGTRSTPVPTSLEAQWCVDREERLRLEKDLLKYWKPQPRHVIFSDSRAGSRYGKLDISIKSHIANIMSSQENKDLWEKNSGLSLDLTQLQYSVLVFPGAKIQELISLADTHLSSYPRDVIYILGGACNVTSKLKGSRQILFNWENDAMLTRHLFVYTEMGLKWTTQRHPAATIVICPLTGSYLQTLAPYAAKLQFMVDKSTRDFNNIVIGLNRESQVAMPWLQKHVHKTRHGVDKNYYTNLPNGSPALPDGLHPSRDLLDLWARDFVISFSKNYLAHSHSFP